MNALFWLTASFAMVAVGLALLYRDFGRGSSVVRREVEAAQKRSEAIFREGERRLLGYPSEKYPRIPGRRGGWSSLFILSGLFCAGITLVRTPESVKVPDASTTPSSIQQVEATTTNKQSGLMVREAPRMDGKIVRELSPGSHIMVACWAVGEWVDERPDAATDHWHKLASPAQGWVSGVYVEVRGAERSC